MYQDQQSGDIMWWRWSDDTEQQPHQDTHLHWLAVQTRMTLRCETAVFDSYGNLIVGDYYNNEVYILDGNQYDLLQIAETLSLTKSNT